MKKLILLLLLVFSLNTFAQKQQVTRDYSIALTVSSSGVKSDWFAVKTRILFNYGNESDKVKLFLENDAFLLTQISETVEGTTTSGMGYYQLEMKDSTGEKIYIQVFKDEKYGVRLIFQDFSTVQVAN